jgi:hypothetical protein
VGLADGVVVRNPVVSRERREERRSLQEDILSQTGEGFVDDLDGCEIVSTP